MKIFWYFCLVILGISFIGKLVGLSGLVEMIEFDAYFFIYVLEVIIVFLSLMALNGFITKTYYFKKKFWAIFFYTLVISSLYNIYDVFVNTDYTNGELLAFVSALSGEIMHPVVLVLLDSVQYGFLFPLLYAVYKYSTNSEELWIRNENT